MVDEEALYRVRTDLESLPICGYDSLVADAPPGLFTAAGRLRLRTLGRVLRALSELGAAQVGEQLHHGEWIMTTDRDLVAERTALHDCASCRAGADQALAYMREHPGAIMLVGLLYWAQTDTPPAARRPMHP
jgi:hypothetical protein